MVSDNTPWIKKYSPEKGTDLIAQDSAMTIMKTFIQNFKSQKKKAILVYGPSGCGKTSSIYAISHELNLEIIEMNASDYRTKGQINSIVGFASKQMSLFGGGKLILIDELDGIAGRQDFGGVAALAKIIAESSWPIIITANNPFDNKFSSIRNKSELVEFKTLSSDDVTIILKNICNKEGIKYDEDSLNMIALRNGGDARAAVNDLQIVTGENKELNKESIKELSDRDRTESIINTLIRIFKSTDVNVAREALNNVTEDLNTCFFWIDENLPKEYTNPLDLARAYDKLSKADVFRGRIRRWQHWRYIVYINDLLTAGIAVSKDEKNKKFVQYKPTGRILKMWWAKQKSMKKKAIAEKIAEKTHTSIKQMVKNIDYYKVIFQNDKEMAESISEYLDLNKEEADWLKKK